LVGNCVNVRKEESEMASRLRKVERSRKEGKCGKCGRKIEVGMPYLWWQFRYGGRHVRCVDHPPDPWELESNSKRAALLEAASLIGEAVDAKETMRASMESAMELVNEAIEEFQEAIDSWQGTNLEGSEMYANFENAISELEMWHSEADSFDSSLGEIEEVPDVEF
jgi:hypothetical protein